MMDEAFALRGMCLVAHTWMCVVREKNWDKDQVKIAKLFLEKLCAFLVSDHLLKNSEVDTTWRKSKWDEETRRRRRWKMEGEVSDGRAGNEVREKEKEVNETL